MGNIFISLFIFMLAGALIVAILSYLIKLIIDSLKNIIKYVVENEVRDVRKSGRSLLERELDGIFTSYESKRT